jgi:hypothetical protein
MKKLVRLSLLMMYGACAQAWNPLKMNDEVRIKLGEQIAAGCLTQKHEQLVRSVFERLNVQEAIALRDSSKEAMLVAPQLTFALYSQPYGYFYINENWFSTLSTQEKEFLIASSVRTFYSHEGIKKDHYLRYAALAYGIAELMAAVGIYKHLGAYTTIAGFQSSWKIKSLATYLSILPFSILVDVARNKLKAKNDVAGLLHSDVYIARKLNCLDGALSLLQKLHKEIEILYNSDPRYWQTWKDSLPRRIENLQQEKANVTAAA